MSSEKSKSGPGVVPSLSPARVFALEYSAAARMHKSLTIPATADHGPLRVTYAVAGVERDDAPTILLVPGMFGGRWWALHPHHLASSMGVRVVSVDRYGSFFFWTAICSALRFFCAFILNTLSAIERDVLNTMACIYPVFIGIPGFAVVC